MKKLDLQVTGMHCPSCSMLVEMTLEELDGVEAVACNHATGLTTVTFDETTVEPAALEGAIEAVGYGATVVADRSADDPTEVAR